MTFEIMDLKIYTCSLKRIKLIWWIHSRKGLTNYTCIKIVKKSSVLLVYIMEIK